MYTRATPTHSRVGRTDPPPSRSTLPQIVRHVCVGCVPILWRHPARSDAARQKMKAARAAPISSSTAWRVRALRALAVAAASAAAAPATPAALAVRGRTLLLARSRWCVLRALDELLGAHGAAVLVLLQQLEPDPAPCLVDLLHDDVEDVTPLNHVLDVRDASWADVRDVEQPIRPLLQLDERTELRRLHDLAGVLVADLRLLRQRLDCRDRLLGLRAFGRVDEDRPVFLDVDLNVVVGLERADRLAALADHHSDLLGVDLDRRDPRRLLAQLRANLGDHLEHLVEDELTRRL